jgi:hypothetical protein
MGEKDQIMPKQPCSACKKTKERLEFSKSQRKQGNLKRCEDCVKYGVWELRVGGQEKHKRKANSKSLANKSRSKMGPRHTMSGR